jgi:hypothetical protein
VLAVEAVCRRFRRVTRRVVWPRWARWIQPGQGLLDPLGPDPDITDRRFRETAERMERMLTAGSGELTGEMVGGLK